MSQTKHPLGYGSSGYDSQAHMGKGKAQKLLWPAVGEHPNKATPGARQAVMSHAGAGGRGKGYNTEAHTTTHHGKSGEAAGHRDDLRPMKYDGALQSEGRGDLPSGGPAMVMKHNHGTSNKAEHHPRSGEPHRFDRPPATEAHGFGYSSAQRKGHLRMSGHSKGHLIGCK
jgi:hypothetical protein